jgi:hypothetical protein
VLWLEEFQLQADRPQIVVPKEFDILVRQPIGRAVLNRQGEVLTLDRFGAAW